MPRRIEATAYCNTMLISGNVISINRPAPCRSWRRVPVGMLEVTTGIREVGRVGEEDTRLPTRTVCATIRSWERSGPSVHR